MNSVFTSIGTYCHARAIWKQLSLSLQAPPSFGAGWVADGCKGAKAYGASWPVVLHLAP